jgi:anti-sigma B factor antagonist
VSAEAETDGLQRMPGPFSARLLAVNQGDGEVAVLSVRGEIDLNTAPVLLEILLPALERGGGRVVVDLSEVTFMDSAGVHLLLNTARRLKPQNRPLAIACCEGAQVHRLLALLGLLDIVAVHRSREDAVTAGDDLIRGQPSPLAQYAL